MNKLEQILGYKKKSPYKEKLFIDIYSNLITMDGVDKDLLLIPDKGKPVMAKANSGEYKFPKATKVREVPFQMGGMKDKPVSPFMDLKPFINTYKMKGDMFQDGGILEDYIRTLPEEQQPDFVNEFAALEPEAQKEVIQFMKGGYYQMGGKLSEVEGGETAVTPDSELVKFKGKKHKDGGIKVDLPGGTRIYSEHLKVPTELAEQVLGKKVKNKMSYADISKKFPTKPYLDILKESDDKYKRESAQIKLMNNLAKLDTLFYAQEQVKEYDLQENFQAGGEVDWTTGMFPTEEYQTQYPTVHTEPSPTVTTGVVLNLRNPKIDPTYDLTLPEVTVKSTPIKVGSKQPKQRSKPNANPVVADSDLLEIPLPFGQLPTTDVRTRQVTSMGEVDDEGVVVKDSEVNTDDVNYPGSKRTKREFGLSSKLTGTIADIGLALSDKLRVSEPTLYDRRKYSLFTRYVDFDDKEVGKMFNQNIDQIQKSKLPEQVKQAQITELLGKYKDYQSKVDFTNLQRYEQKRERDTDKLQSYMDANIDIKVSDLDNYRQRKARVNELRDTFNAQRKSRVVNSLKAYADYVDKINYTNQMIPNYSVNPVTGRIDYKANQQSNLTQDILNKYSKNANNKVNLGNGLTGVVMGGKMVVTNADGSKFEVVNLEQ